MVHLRNEILRKPLGLSFDKEELEQEKEDILMGAYEDDRLLGCCLMSRMDAATIRLRQMAVPNNMQGKGIGRALMILRKTSPATWAIGNCACMPGQRLSAFIRNWAIVLTAKSLRK